MFRFSLLIIFLAFSLLTFSCGQDGDQTSVEKPLSSSKPNSQSEETTPDKIKSSKDIQELGELVAKYEENPDDYSVAFQLIQRYESFDMIDDALLVLDKFISSSTDASKDRARMDRALINSRYKDKSFAFEELLDLAENGQVEYQAEAYFQLGNLLAIEGFNPPEGDRIELATEYFIHASKLESGNALLYKRLADLKYSTGELEEAREYLAIFLVVYPDDWLSWIDLAEWSIEAGDLEKARKFFERALDSENEEIINIAKKALADLNNK